MLVAKYVEVFLIFLPAFLANASPVVAKNIPGIRRLSWPINAKLLGKNKTVRGLVTGIIVGILTGIILYLLRYGFIEYLPSYTDIYNLYSSLIGAIIVGGILATGALVGDIVKSFVKRRLGKKPGTMFQPWDGIDYMVGAMIFILPWYQVSFFECLFLLIAWPLLSLLMNTIAYSIGWKECWY